MNMDSVENLIFEEHKDFTISIVTSEFAVQRGHSFFKQYENSPNFISTKKDYDKIINRVLRVIARKIPPLADLIKICFSQAFTIENLTDIIDALFKLFSAHEHQAAGPEVIDPIIVQEHMFTNRDIAELINLHRNSVLRPRVVIVLRDNDLNRAKKLLRFCHHGLRVRMIANKGIVEICSVINTGTDDVEQFIDIYARQCFDACSRTKANIIVNDEWAEDSSVRRYAPSLLQFRTNVIYDNKSRIAGELDTFINDLSSKDNKLTSIELGFKCLAHLFRVYCQDSGGKDIGFAHSIAKELKNDILLAHVYRYAHFMPSSTKAQQNEHLLKAQKIFNRESMADHSTYCENNRLVNSFYDDHIVLATFDDMLAKARADVPGLVGLSTIWNNVGVAYLYNSRNTEAIECFRKGLAHYPDTTKQLGLMSNLLIAKHRAGEMISPAEISNAIDHCMLYFGPGPFAFLGANNLINILKVCNVDLAHEQVMRHPISQVIAQGLHGKLGSSSLGTQVEKNVQMLSKMGIVLDGTRPITPPSSGVRNRYIEVTGFNPAIYNVWF